METRHKTAPRTTDRARQLRHDSTGPERALWQVLRNGRLSGFKFRRQYAVGPYVTDFACVSSQLVIELDGMSHLGRAKFDDARQRFLESEGWRVLRFTNDDVLTALEPVADAILAAAQSPLPSRERVSRYSVTGEGEARENESSDCGRLERGKSVRSAPHLTSPRRGEGPESRPSSGMVRDQRGATTLEYALLLAAIALPSALIFRWALGLLLYQYGMMSMMISLPFP